MFIHLNKVYESDLNLKSQKILCVPWSSFVTQCVTNYTYTSYIQWENVNFQIDWIFLIFDSFFLLCSCCCCSCCLVFMFKQEVCIVVWELDKHWYLHFKLYICTSNIESSLLDLTFIFVPSFWKGNQIKIRFFMKYFLKMKWIENFYVVLWWKFWHSNQF